MSLGEPIDLGGGPRVSAPPPAAARTPGPQLGAPVRMPPRVAELDDLGDVDAPPGLPGVLERQGDGQVRPIPREDITTDWFSGHGDPPAVIPGAGRGDMYLDLDTGTLHRLN